MKLTTAAALLPLLASAVEFDARQAADLKFEIQDFSAVCTPEDANCLYQFSISTSDTDFTAGCDALGTSEKGQLPTSSEGKCGTYIVEFAKLDDGRLRMVVNQRQRHLTGIYYISGDDITTAASGGQSYTGDSSFAIEAKPEGSLPTSAPATTSSTSTTTTTPSPTTAPEPTTATGTPTSSSPAPNESNGATRDRASAGVMFAAGLLAYIL
ncbi:hypothetical protein F5Y17DRAFT_474270 [Xylariaceae sp. FL0594]|nr:hypothetical protein F5Y17DRAFT_474270 [Xylariaceae sp. FL0594]